MVAMTLQTWPVFIPITLSSIIIVLLSGEKMAASYKAGLGTLVLGYLIGGIVFASVAVQTYLWMDGRWPASAAMIYLTVALVLAAVLTIAAVVLARAEENTPVVAWTVMNFMWALGYGLMIPRLLG